MIELVFFQEIGGGSLEVKSLYFKSVDEVKQLTGADSLDKNLWIDSLGNQTRFESVPVYNWLRDIKKTTNPTGGQTGEM